MTNVTEVEGLRIASATDVGRRRSENEDSHAVWLSDDPDERRRRGVLFMVADGMGGANAGEVASHMATEVVVNAYRERGDTDPADVLRDAIESANAAIHDQAGSNADQRGMGTTCTAVVVREKDVWIGHVGDSRAYLVRGGTVTRLTRDHSLVAELVERGHLTEEDAKHDPRRNVVTRSVGATDAVQVDAERMSEQLRTGDVLVVCSDGLHGQVTDDEIGRLASEFEPEDACVRLIEKANERGGPDNITVIVARAGNGDAAVATPTEAPAEHARLPRRAPLPLLVVALGATLVVIALLGSRVIALLKAPAAPVATSQAEGPDEPPPAAEGPPGSASPTPAAAPARPPARAATPVTESRPAPTRVAPPAAPARTTGSLFVVSRPFQPCDFSIDGRTYSEAVGSIRVPDLAAGRHVVKVQAATGSVELELDIAANDITESIAILPGADDVGSLQVSVRGTGTARLFIDGAQYPRLAPCLVRDLPPGAHKLRAIRQGGRSMTVDVMVDVTSGGTTPVEIAFDSTP